MTYKELAKQLEISQATLSLIVNNKPGISDRTRAEIIDKIMSLGYGNMLRGGAEPRKAENGTIGFIVYHGHGLFVEHAPFFMLLMEGIEQCAREQHGYTIQFVSYYRNRSAPEQIRMFNESDCIGYILYAVEMDPEDFQVFESLKKPYVVLANDFAGLDHDCVIYDNRLGCHQAIEYLAEMGHKELGYLRCRVRNSTFIERNASFRASIEEYGLKLKENCVFDLDCVEENSYGDFKAILGSGAELPTAFVADEDTIAIGAIMALEEKGIKVPDDISIIGFNDRPLSSVFMPLLTTIRLPRYSFGAMAVNVLADRIARCTSLNDLGDCAIKYKIGTELVVRNSVKKV